MHEPYLSWLFCGGGSRLQIKFVDAMCGANVLKMPLEPISKISEIFAIFIRTILANFFPENAFGFRRRILLHFSFFPQLGATYGIPRAHFSILVWDLKGGLPVTVCKVLTRPSPPLFQPRFPHNFMQKSDRYCHMNAYQSLYKKFGLDSGEVVEITHTPRWTPGPRVGYHCRELWVMRSNLGGQNDDSVDPKIMGYGPQLMGGYQELQEVWVKRGLTCCRSERQCLLRTDRYHRYRILKTHI